MTFDPHLGVTFDPHVLIPVITVIKGAAKRARIRTPFHPVSSPFALLKSCKSAAAFGLTYLGIKTTKTTLSGGGGVGGGLFM